MTNKNQIQTKVRELKLHGKTDDQIRETLSSEKASSVESALSALSYMQVNKDAAANYAASPQEKDYYSNESLQPQELEYSESAMKVMQASVTSIIRRRRREGYLLMVVVIILGIYLAHQTDRENFYVIGLILSPFLVGAVVEIVSGIGNHPVPKHSYRKINKLIFLYPAKFAHARSLYQSYRMRYAALHPARGRRGSRSNPRGLPGAQLFMEGVERRHDAEVFQEKVSRAEYVERYFVLLEKAHQERQSID